MNNNNNLTPSASTKERGDNLQNSHILWRGSGGEVPRYSTISILPFFIIVWVILNTANLFAQFKHSTIDTVIFFKPGTGQNIGQSPEFFPKNIFGLPDTNATDYVPATSEDQICSLGLGGEIIVAFKDFEIVDGHGPDFTIFENAFINQINGKIFAEPGKVAVSEDGINFFEFPFDSATLEGCAGVTTTHGKSNPFDPTISGGNSFDLSTIGLNRAKFIKITDISQMLLDNKNHKYYDPTITGFDLDAIVGINLISQIPLSIINDYDNTSFKIFQSNDLINVKYQKDKLTENFVIIYDLMGNIISKYEFHNKSIFNINHLPNGFYFVMIYNIKEKFSSKILISR
jgi:hypothetical protein